MTVKEILTPIIEQELGRYGQGGYKVTLKTPEKRRKIYTIACGLFILSYFILFKELPGLAIPFSIPIYIMMASKLFKTKKSIIISLILYIVFIPTIYDFLSNPLCVPLIVFIYIFLMAKTNKYDTIISLARKMPDTPIEQIIAQEVITKYSSKANKTVKTIVVLLSIGLVIFFGKDGIGYLYNNATDFFYNACNTYLENFSSELLDNTENNTENNSEVSSVEKSEDNIYEIYNGGYKLVSCGSQDINSASITIPNQYKGLDVVAIGNHAFSGFNNLQTIQIPNTVTEIDERAFENCSSLNNVVIPDSVTTIRSGAFMNCSSLANITFGYGITAIEGECFKGCTSLTDFSVPSNVTEIRGSCFEGCTSLKSVSLHNQITAIHARAFTNCSSLEYIILPENITEIRESTFENCASLKEISIPDGVTRIAAHSFRGCYYLNKVKVPKSVSEIGSSAFRNCNSLISIEIPKGCTVDERAFKNSPTKINYK